MLRFNLLDNILNNGRINIHKSITAEFRKIYYGSAIVQYCISDGFLYVRGKMALYGNTGNGVQPL